MELKINNEMMFFILLFLDMDSNFIHLNIQRCRYSLQELLLQKPKSLKPKFKYFHVERSLQSITQASTTGGKNWAKLTMRENPLTYLSSWWIPQKQFRRQPFLFQQHSYCFLDPTVALHQQHLLQKHMVFPRQSCPWIPFQHCNSLATPFWTPSSSMIAAASIAACTSQFHCCDLSSWQKQL